MKRCIICLQELELFRGLNQNQFATICRAGTKKKLARGNYLFRQGELTSTVYLIKSGKLKLIQTYENGRERILDICSAGEVLGELSLFQEQEQPASAVAMEETFVCCFGKEQFEGILKQEHAIAMRIISYLAQKRYESLLRPGKESGQTVKERLLKLFYALAQKCGRPTPTSTVIELKLTQQELADMVGASRVMVAQALRELKASNIISCQRGYYALREDPCVKAYFTEK